MVSVLSLALGVGVLIGNNPTSVIRLSPNPLPNAPHWRSGIHLIHNGWFVLRDAPYGDLFNGADVLIPAAIAWLCASGFLWLVDGTCRRVSVAGWLLVGFTGSAFLFGRDPLAWSWLAGTMTTALALVLSAPIDAMTRSKEAHQSSLIEETASDWLIKSIFLRSLQIGLIIIAAFLSRQFLPFSLILALALLPVPVHQRIPRAAWGVIALLLVAIVLTTPSLPHLDYPVDGRVTDWLEATEMARPLVGPDAPLSHVDIRTMQRRLAPPLVMMAMFSALTLCIVTTRLTAWVALASSLLALSDTFPLRPIQESSILLAVGRLFPHGTSYPLAWLLAGSIPVVLAITLVRARSAWLAFFGLAGIGAILLLDSQHPSRLPPLLSGTLSQQLAPDVLVTPSRLIIEHNERAFLSMLKHRDAVSHPLSSFGAQIAASANSSAAQLLLTSNQWQRWTPGGGRQRGTDWLAIRLSSPHEILGLTLSSGSFVNDFARGLMLSSKETCSEGWLADPKTQSATFHPLVTFDHWMGPILLTPAGLPYYGLLPDMTIYLSRKTTVQCLFIQQTGIAMNDWSLTSVKLLIGADEKRNEPT